MLAPATTCARSPEEWPLIGIFTRRGVEALERIARERSLLAFDFDGTLAPLVEDRGAARIGRSTRALLRAAARKFPLAVVSGRAREDLVARVDGIPGVALVGNHGADPGPPLRLDRNLRRRVAAWAATLASVFSSARGVEVEDKGLTLSVHYRKARDPDATRRRILAAARALPDVRVTGGHAVVNVIPAELPTKGSALEKLAPGFGCTAVLFAGDDLTDEDAFESPVVDVAIRVGRDAGSAARYFLEEREQVDALLEVLLAARARRG